MAANYAIGTAGYDTTFELNEFNEPRICSEIETIKNVLLFVLFSKPGAYPSLPQIGLNINDLLYSFYDELDVDDLKAKISEQCSMLGTYIARSNIQIKKTMYQNRPSLMIQVLGKETFPPKYKADKVGNSKRFLIGITYDELNRMIYNINGKNV